MSLFLKVDVAAIHEDSRYNVLAELAGYANRHMARGMLECVWLVCLRSGTGQIPVVVVDEILGKGVHRAVVDARLAEFVNATTLRIFGFAGRADWTPEAKSQALESRRRGGINSAAKAARSGGRFAPKNPPAATGSAGDAPLNDFNDITPAHRLKPPADPPAATGSISAGENASAQKSNEPIVINGKTSKRTRSGNATGSNRRQPVNKSVESLTTHRLPPAKIRDQRLENYIESSSACALSDSSGAGETPERPLTRAQLKSFAPNAEHTTRAHKLGLDIDEERLNFVAHYVNKPTLEIYDVDATFARWLNGTAKKQKTEEASKRGRFPSGTDVSMQPIVTKPPREIPIEELPDLPEYLRDMHRKIAAAENGDQTP